MKNKDIREYYVYLWKIHFDLEYNLFLLKNYLSIETVDRVFEKRKRIQNPFDNPILFMYGDLEYIVLDKGRYIAQSLRIILSYITRIKFVR